MTDKKPPRIYIDTNIILDIIEDRREESKILLDAIKREKWYCCTSVFAICEAIDKRQEFSHAENLRKAKFTLDDILRHKREKKLTQEQRSDAIEKVSDFLTQYNIEQFTLEEKGWETAFTILEDINIDAPDVVHLTTAIENNCTLFITNDEDMEKEARKKIPTLTAKKAILALGIKPNQI